MISLSTSIVYAICSQEKIMDIAEYTLLFPPKVRNTGKAVLPTAIYKNPCLVLSRGSNFYKF